MQVKARVKDKKLVHEKRRQILEGAIQVFKKRGFHKATVREIAEEARLGLGTIYDYVHSKDDILYLFFENYATTFFEKIQSGPSQADEPALKLERTYRAVVEAIMELEDQVMLAYTQARYVKKHHLRIILRREMEIISHFQKIIEEIVPDPRLSFLEANFLVFSSVFGVLRRWILKPRFQKKEIIEFLVQRQMKGLAERNRSSAKTARRKR
jgi:AcrR family transcriptional regulator